MIRFNVPGLGEYRLEHLVMDVNGTLAVDGELIEGVAWKLSTLQGLVRIHLLTADTHGKQYLIDQQLGLTAVRIQPGGEAFQKAEYVSRLGSENRCGGRPGGERRGDAQSGQAGHLCAFRGGRRPGYAAGL